MKPEDIKLSDYPRIFLGEVPPSFLFEVVLRTTFIYFLLILSMRLMGKRMASQLSRNEMATLVSLSAAVGISIQAPDRGLAPALVSCLVVVGIQIMVAKAASKSERFEKFSQDETDILVSDGVLMLSCMRKTLMTKERIYAQLRSEGLTNLSEVKTMYLEPNGVLTIIRAEKLKSGLNILPDWDQEFRSEFKEDPQMISCENCGFTHERHSSHLDCPKCREFTWIPSSLVRP
jgi:uncharacterized membrane protein YcaP (DUF421 family)